MAKSCCNEEHEPHSLVKKETVINQTPLRPAPVYRPGLWLVFLLVGLSLPVTYLLQAPAPVGTGLLRVFGWGGLIGAGAGAIVRLSCSSIFDASTWWSRIRVSAGCIALGAFGGAGGGAWLDQLRVVERQAVELPIVEVEQLPSSAIKIATLSPFDPTGQDHVAAEDIDGRQIQEGYCLTGTVERGWLGGVWIRRYKASLCSKQRGVPGSHVIVSTSDFSSWRWHQPRNYRPEQQGRAWDDAVPVDLTCRVRPGSWLYRCLSR